MPSALYCLSVTLQLIATITVISTCVLEDSIRGNGLPINIMVEDGGGAVLFLLILFCVVLLSCK